MVELVFKGLTIRVNPLFFALFPASAALGVTGQLIVLLVSAFMHETAHMLAGLVSGARPDRLEIRLLGLTARLPDIEFLPAANKYAVYIAGPVTNLFAALAAFRIGYDFAYIINLAFFAFNMMPARTLDGGRILGTFLSRRIGFLRASRVMNRVNRAMCIILMALGIVQAVLYPLNLSLYLLGFILLRQGKTESAAECLRFTLALMHGRKYTDTRRITAVRSTAFSIETPVKMLFDYLNYDTLASFYIYDSSGITTILSEHDLIQRIKMQGITGNIGDHPETKPN